MTDAPKNNGRKSDGTFTAGNRLGGRTRGARNKTTLAVEALLQGEYEGLTRVAVEKALAGDVTAMRLCLDRIAPPRKDAPIAFALSPINCAADAKQAGSEILTAVSTGEITPEEGARVMALLATHLTLIETAELDARVTALEERQAENEKSGR